MFRLIVHQCVKKAASEEQAQKPEPETFVEPHREARVFIPPNATSKINKPPKPGSVAKSKKANTSNAMMDRYKGSLRQALFSKLAVTSIQGVGNCEIEFSVDKSGKLLNRRFSKLSENKSLNDAVYNMLMSVPQYSPPPTEYNGEKIRISFSFDNGYYEVSY